MRMTWSVRFAFLYPLCPNTVKLRFEARAFVLLAMLPTKSAEQSLPSALKPWVQRWEETFSKREIQTQRLTWFWPENDKRTLSFWHFVQAFFVTAGQDSAHSFADWCTSEAVNDTADYWQITVDDVYDVDVLVHDLTHRHLDRLDLTTQRLLSMPIWNKLLSLKFQPFCRFAECRISRFTTWFQHGILLDFVGQT